MADFRSKIPVTVYKSRIGIIIPEYAVIHLSSPDVFLISCPPGQNFCAGNHRSKLFLRAVYNRSFFCTGIGRIDIFPINARHNKHLISRDSEL